MGRVTDAERREVARRVREFAETDAGRVNHGFWNRLADLIEPEPERTARLEYDEIHDCNFCAGCGERYEYDKYISLTDDYLIAFKPMRFCPNCGVRFKEDDGGNE